MWRKRTGYPTGAFFMNEGNYQEIIYMKRYVFAEGHLLLCTIIQSRNSDSLVCRRRWIYRFGSISYCMMHSIRLDVFIKRFYTALEIFPFSSHSSHSLDSNSFSAQIEASVSEMRYPFFVHLATSVNDVRSVLTLQTPPS